MDALFVPLANAVGASVDQVKLITCLLISYPLGSLFIRVPSSSPGLKHVFNVSISLFYLLAVFDLWLGFLQLLVSVLATYVIAATVKTPKMPWLVFIVVMGHLTINHLIRAIFNLSYETFEITGPQMVLTMKLTTFAWNVWDGRRPESELDKWQLANRVTKYPSLLAFLGYAFYFPGFLVGPYLEYASYAALIDESTFVTPKGKEKQFPPGRRIPKGRKRVAYRRLVIGLIYLGLYVSLIGKFNFGVALEDWFVRKSFVYRIAYYQLCGFFERTKYYAIWTLTEGASIITGLGFTGYGPAGQSLWKGAANVDVAQIEFAPNFKVLLDFWNMKTNVWLRECVYKRVTPPGKKPGFKSTMTTFATSAFWHGVAGGYYLTFAFGGFVQTVGRLYRANVRPLVLALDSTSATEPTIIKRAYDVLGTVCTILLLNYTAAPFMLLGVSSSFTAWKRLGWYGHWMIGGSMTFFYLGGKKWLMSMQPRKVKPAAEQMVKTPSAELPVTPGPHVIPPVDLAMKSMEKRMD